MTSEKTSEILSEFLSLWRSINSQCPKAEQELVKYNDATQDLLHQIELGTYDNRNKFATRLARVRQERRRHKDYLDINNPLYVLFQQPEAIKFYRTLEQLLGQIRKQEQYVEGHRTYKAKVVKDLTINTKEMKNE